MAKLTPKIDEVIVPDIVDSILNNLQVKSKNAFDDYIRDIKLRANELVSSGVTDPEEIRKILYDDIINNTGEFKKLSGSLGTVIDAGLYQVSNASSNVPIKALSDQFEWVLDKAAENCDTCIKNSTQIHTFGEWEQIGLPGYGRTICGKYCKCILQPV